MSETPESDETPVEPTQLAQPNQPNQPNQSVEAVEPEQPTPAAPSAPDQPAQPTPQPKPQKATTPAVATKRGTARSIHYNLSYLVANEASGPQGAMVLLHDLPGGAFVWDGVLPQLAATGRAVYAFDLLGFGQSDHPWPSDTSIWGHADALLYAFQGLKLDKVTLVGIGQGGAVAQVLANRLFREQVARLALLNSYAFETAFAPNWPLTEMTKRQDPEAAFHDKVEDVLSDLRSTLPNGATRAISKDRLAAYTDEWNSTSGKQLLYQHVRLMNPSYLNSVASDNGKLKIPVLLLWGAQNTVTPPALGERLRDEIPGAQYAAIGNAGHLLLEDAPAEVAQRLAEFAR